MAASTSQRIPYCVLAAWEIGSRKMGPRNVWMTKLGPPWTAGPGRASTKLGFELVGEPSLWWSGAWLGAGAPPPLERGLGGGGGAAARGGGGGGARGGPPPAAGGGAGGRGVGSRRGRVTLGAVGGARATSVTR